MLESRVLITFFGAPPKKAPDDREVGATLGLLNSLLALLTKSGVTHVGCAFDHVIESFRNDLFLGYKTSAGAGLVGCLVPLVFAGVVMLLLLALRWHVTPLRWTPAGKQLIIVAHASCACL